ncbi:MAG: M48 family metalloprotease [Acidobacteriota bacterium]|nr:M48 family metalloprotease [Acidobacteriota bacterium]
MVLGTADGSLAVFFGAAVGFMLASLFAGAARRRRGGRRGRSGHDGGGGFLTPSPGRVSDPRRLQARALLIVAYAVWAAVLTAYGEPVLGPVAALVLLEFALALLRAAAVTGGVVEDTGVADRVGALMTELCRRAGCPCPSMVLRDDAVRAAAVRRVQGQVAIVLSRPFAAAVTDEELTALLAHELVHVLRDDLAAARRRWLASSLAGLALAVAAGVAVRVSILAAAPVLTAAWLVGTMASNVALSPLNRWREERADAEGALLGGDPGARARALAKTQSSSREMRAQLYGRAPWRWLLFPLSWRMPTHPPMARRLARLEARS